MGGGSHKRASCEISVRYPRSECTIRSRHQMARMRVHRHSKCCRYASAAGKIVASVSVCRPRWPHGGNLKHSHTLKIRRPSVLTPGKYPASLSQLRILRSNYEYGKLGPWAHGSSLSPTSAASHLPSPRGWGRRCPSTLLSAASLVDSSSLCSAIVKPSLYLFLTGPTSRRYQQLHRPAGAPERAGLCDSDAASARI